MSKMDALRAMREARYEEAMARAAKSTGTPKTTRMSGAKKRPAAEPADAEAPAAQQEAALCGHRAISGRSCTRELGHAAKSHRYS